MPYSLNLNSRLPQVTAELEAALNASGADVLPAALAIARIEYPALDSQPYLDRIEVMGRKAASRLAGIVAVPSEAIPALNEYLFE